MLKKMIANKKDQAVKIIAPKIVTGLANIMRLGPRMIFRSSMELMRANLLTRILSCATLLVIDVYDLVKKQISKTQFIKNVILSAMLIISGTVGWNWGSQWIVLEFFGGFVDIAGGIIGAGIMTVISNFVLDKASGKLIETDAQKMWKILDPHIEKLDKPEQKEVRDKITCTCLKKMYASENKEKYAADLITRLRNGEKAGGIIRAEAH
jgi:branched-subunit amino acid transport protein AzlD